MLQLSSVMIYCLFIPVGVGDADGYEGDDIVVLTNTYKEVWLSAPAFIRTIVRCMEVESK